MRLTQILYLTTKPNFIRNLDLKSCINCINFIRYKNNYPQESLTNNREYGMCEIFGEKNMVTGDIIYNRASQSRDDETKCGRLGKYYEEIIKK